MVEVIKVSDCANNIGDYDIPIHNALIIPKGTTNGNVVENFFGKDVYCTLIRMMYSSCCEKLKDWWNAPFKAESEEI